jgi:hypothetical protein
MLKDERLSLAGNCTRVLMSLPGGEGGGEGGVARGAALVEASVVGFLDVGAFVLSSFFWAPFLLFG